MELIDFGMYISPSESEHKMRLNLIKKLKIIFRIIWPKCNVKVFGSMKTKLYLPTSDIDIVVFNAKKRIKRNNNSSNGSSDANSDDSDNRDDSDIDNSFIESDPKFELTQELRKRDMVSYIEIIASARV